MPSVTAHGLLNTEWKWELRNCSYHYLKYIYLYILSRFMENPGKRHWEAAKRVLRYLRGTSELGVVFNGNITYGYTERSFNIEAYSDADWGRDLYGRKSIYGFIVYLNGCPIAWVSKKQTFVAQSTCESEYVGMSEATREIRWVYQMLQELGMKVNELPTPTLLGDNVSSIRIASNSGLDSRIRSIDIKYHYIKDAVAMKHIQLQHISSESNVADIFTKPLSSNKFIGFRNAILGEDSTS